MLSPVWTKGASTSFILVGSNLKKIKIHALMAGAESTIPKVSILL
jgi:hypothetical protein